MKTQRMPEARPRRLLEIPAREAAAMRTVMMATQPFAAAETRASDEPARTAAVLAKIAEVATRYSENEARFAVRMVLAALGAGAFDQAKRYLETYVQRVGFIGAPPAAAQEALRADLVFVRGRMPPERQRHLDQLFSEVRARYPKAWIVNLFDR